jgi:hypothetical protein
MPDNTEAAALRSCLEAIIKEAEDAEAQAAAARRHVQASRLLLKEEESKAIALEQTTTAVRQRVPSSPSSTSSLAAASPLVPTASSTYEDTVIIRLHLQVAAVLNVRQLVNIVLNSSSTSYTTWHDLMEQALQSYALLQHVTDDTPSTDPGWIRMDNIILNWISNSTSGSPSRTNFSVTVSNIVFTLMLPFVLLFRVTSRSMSAAASSRPRLTVWVISVHPLKTGSSFSTSFGG